MRVLVVGGGGREHALVHAFCASPHATQVFCAPGNAGIGQEADSVAIEADDLSGLLSFARREKIDLTVVGPEAPLVAGVADLFAENGLLVFGPTRDAARLEGSKAFAKEIMNDAHVATGRYRRHDDLAAALRDLDDPRVLPARGQGRRPGRRQGRDHLSRRRRGRARRSGSASTTAPSARPAARC